MLGKDKCLKKKIKQVKGMGNDWKWGGSRTSSVGRRCEHVEVAQSRAGQIWRAPGSVWRPEWLEQNEARSKWTVGLHRLRSGHKLTLVIWESTGGF